MNKQKIGVSLFANERDVLRFKDGQVYVVMNGKDVPVNLAADLISNRIQGVAQECVGRIVSKISEGIRKP